MDNYTEMLGNIRSRDDFIAFMRLFSAAQQDTSVRDYLEALTAWAEDMDGYYKNADRKAPENIDWDLIASLLYAGSIYE